MHGADLNIPLGLMFDRVVKSEKTSDIHTLAYSYTQNPHFQNDRELWRTFIDHFKTCQDDEQRLRWLRFCLKALDSKSLEQIKQHEGEFTHLLEEIGKVDALSKVLIEFQQLPVQKKENERAFEVLSFVLKTESEPIRGLGLTVPWFVSIEAFINAVQEKYPSLTVMEKERILELLKFMQGDNLLSHPRIKKKVRQLAFKGMEEGVTKGAELLESLRRENSALFQMGYPEKNSKSFKEIAETGFKEEHLDDMLDDIKTYEMILMNRLTVEDFIGLAWSKGRGPNIKKYTVFFNDLSETIKESILKGETKKGQARLIIFWIEMAIKAFAQNDINLTVAIILVIDSVSNSQLKEAWTQVPKLIIEKKDELLEIFFPGGNFKKLQQHVDNLNLARIGYIPFIAPYLTHLTFIEEANKNEIDGHLNVEKAQMIAKTLGKIFRNKVQVEEKSIYRTHIIKIISEREPHATTRSSTIFSKRGSLVL